MNKVFEGYVRNQLRIAARSVSLRVGEKALAKRDLCPQVKLEPDMLFTHSGKPVIVADFKYKVDWEKINSDIYQMLAYLEGYKLDIAVIFYPSTEGRQEKLIKLPRERDLWVIGLPIQELFNPTFWRNQVAALELRTQSSTDVAHDRVS